MTKNYDGADDEDDQHHGHLLESFSLLPEELGPISLIVSNTINLQKIIFDNDGDGDLYIIGAVCLSVCVSAKVIISVFKGFDRFSCNDQIP